MIAIRWLVSTTYFLIAGYCYGEVTAYRGATLIDGMRNGVLENATILVKGDRFIAAGVDVVIPEDAAVVDVTGKWIVPGLDRRTCTLYDFRTDVHTPSFL